MGRGWGCVSSSRRMARKKGVTETLVWQGLQRNEQIILFTLVLNHEMWHRYTHRYWFSKIFKTCHFQQLFFFSQCKKTCILVLFIMYLYWWPLPEITQKVKTKISLHTISTNSVYHSDKYMHVCKSLHSMTLYHT